MLSFLYSPTLTSTHDYWKNHRFDWTDLCWQPLKWMSPVSRVGDGHLGLRKGLLVRWEGKGFWEEVTASFCEREWGKERLIKEPDHEI